MVTRIYFVLRNIVGILSHCREEFNTEPVKGKKWVLQHAFMEKGKKIGAYEKV